MTRNALIIGGSSGIGLQTARSLIDNYDVVIGGRNEIEEPRIKFLPIDVASEDSIGRFFELLPFKKIDALIFSAGTTTPKKPITEFSVDEYYRVHDVNLLGAILVLKHAYPLLLKARGRVVVISSFAARTYSAFSGFEYTVSKAGLGGLVKQLAVEWADDQILINSVFPSMVATPMLMNNVDQIVLNNVEKRIPLGRIAAPQDIVTTIEFLISENNNYITGAGIDVNGGQYLSG